MNMLDILSNYDRFTSKFCSEKTIENLAGIDPEHLRKVILDIYQVTKFSAAASPERWEPTPSQQPIVVLGCMSSNGKVTMNAPRFGLCTDVSAMATRGATGIYLWVDHRALDKLPLQFRPFARSSSPFNWRTEELRKAKPNRFFRVSEPLYSSENGYRNITDIRVEGSDRIVGLDDLVRELGTLLKRPNITAVRSVEPHARKIGLDPGLYTPAAISAFNANMGSDSAKTAQLTHLNS